MSRLVTTAALLALTGCATVTDFVQDHPRATAAIAASVMLSVVLTLEQNHEHGPVMLPPEPRMSTPLTPDCAIYVELCK